MREFAVSNSNKRCYVRIMSVIKDFHSVFKNWIRSQTNFKISTRKVSNLNEHNQNGCAVQESARLKISTAG